MAGYHVLFCASEVFPLIKTGGLADVAGSLPHALSKTGHDVRVVLPAYRDVLDKLKHPPKVLVETRIQQYPLRICQTTLPGTRVIVWLIDCPELFDRPGNPYHDEHGQPWPDNAQRFALFCRCIVSIALNQCGLQWQPHVVHCNDWQTGLVPALLHTDSGRPATVFTIHNLAYQGIFDRETFEDLQLSEWYWHYERLEYHGQLSFIKGGLVFADQINTVSPNYAREIQTPEFGHGLEDLLQHRANRLSGIINGIDMQTWNPGTDPHLAHKFNRQRLADKQLNKAVLQQHFNLPQEEDKLLLALISRLAEQKGIDLLLSIVPELIKRPVQLAILGSGNKDYEKLLRLLADKWPQHMQVHLGYDETLAHLIEAGADAFLMPSRFEPCGLNQMYSQRYGTLPIVSPVGGLYDTVVDATEETLAENTATGFVMQSIDEQGLLDAIDRCLVTYQQAEMWQSMMKTAMQQDFSWVKSAEAYSLLYSVAVRNNPKSL